MASMCLYRTLVKSSRRYSFSEASASSTPNLCNAVVATKLVEVRQGHVCDLLARSPLVWWFVGGSNFSKCDVSRPATAGRPQSTRLAAAPAQFGTDRRRVLWAFTRHEKAERRELAMLFSGSMRYSQDRYKLTAWPAELVKPSYRSNPEWRAKMASWAAFSIT